MYFFSGPKIQEQPAFTDLFISDCHSRILSFQDPETTNIRKDGLVVIYKEEWP